MIEIRCTKDEKMHLIEALANSEHCIFNSSDVPCNDGGNCYTCLLNHINFVDEFVQPEALHTIEVRDTLKELLDVLPLNSTVSFTKFKNEEDKENVREDNNLN